jgi:hypothetical protein
MTQTITVEATSKAGTTRPVRAWMRDGQVVGIFRRIAASYEQMTSEVVPIKGRLETLATFATRQPRLFATWVDAKFGVQ